MQRTLCQVVLSSSVLMAGCFMNHGEDGPLPVPDGGTSDARSDRPLPDSGTDAPLPPPPDCDPSAVIVARADRACTPFGNGTLPAGVESDLWVASETCPCAEVFQCSASIGTWQGGQTAIMLQTQLCQTGDDILCELCDPEYDGVDHNTTCRIPALEVGSYPVVINGEIGFTASVAEPATGIEAVETCFDTAPIAAAPALIDCNWPGSPPPQAEVCHPTSLNNGARARFTVAENCGGCTDIAGACEVTVTGQTIQVDARIRQCSTALDVECPEICMRAEVVCHSPPLSPGRYDVIHSSGYRAQLLVDDGAPLGPIQCGVAATDGGSTDPDP